MTNLALASIKATGSTTTRSLGTRAAEVINVKDYGATGDGSTNDTTAIQAAIDAAFGTTGSPHGGNSPGIYTNKSLFFPNGHYIITSALTLTSVAGAHIYGGGRLSTLIENTTTNGSVFLTNGFMYSKVENISLLTPAGTGSCFEMYWDGTGSASSQSVTFADMTFGGLGSYGLKIPSTSNMGSEILSSNCYYNNFSAAGIYVGEANALQITVVGGNISQCAKGIYCQNGSMSTILGVSFQLNTTMDIHIQGGIQDGWIIAGCRSESTNFLESQPDSFVSVIGCTQTSSADGYFLNNCGSKMTVISCHSVNGKVHGSSSLNVIGSKFDRSDWNAWFGSIGGELSVAPYVTRTANLALTSAMSGTIFDNIGASAEVDFTLPTDSNAGRLPPGTWYGFYVAAAQILKIKTGTGANIRIAASTSTTTTGDIHASTIGNYVELMCTADGGSTWVARSTIGTWTIV